MLECRYDASGTTKYVAIVSTNAERIIERSGGSTPFGSDGVGAVDFDEHIE
jgi:hypothetical protein